MCSLYILIYKTSPHITHPHTVTDQCRFAGSLRQYHSAQYCRGAIAFQSYTMTENTRQHNATEWLNSYSSSCKNYSQSFIYHLDRCVHAQSVLIFWVEFRTSTSTTSPSTLVSICWFTAAIFSNSIHTFFCCSIASSSPVYKGSIHGNSSE